MAGTCSLLPPDLGALVSWPAVALCAPLSLACTPVLSIPPSPLFVWGINLSVKLSSSAGHVSHRGVTLAGVDGSHQPLVQPADDYGGI